MQRSGRPARRPLGTVPKAGDVRRPLLIAGVLRTNDHDDGPA
jgi:hypothetical protein